MKKNFPGKLKNNKSGFSIAEALIAVLILLMVSSVVAAGMPVAAKAYTQVVDSANAQLLLSTTVTALRDELGEGVLEDGAVSGKTITYTSSTGGASSIEFGNESVNITAANVNGGVARKLVSDKAAAGMVFSFDPAETTPVDYNSATGVVTLKNIIITRIGKTEPLATLSQLDIKVIGK